MGRVIYYTKPQAPFLGADFSNISGNSDIAHNLFSGADGEGGGSSQLTPEQIEALTKSGQDVANMIKNRKRNEYRQALIASCGRRPIGIGKKHKKKLDEYKKCKSNFQAEQSQKNPSDKYIIQNIDDIPPAEVKILGMKPLVLGLVVVGVAVAGFLGYKYFKSRKG